MALSSTPIDPRGVRPLTRLTRLSMLALLAGLILVAGCGTPLKPMQMANRMGRANEKMATAARKFYKALEPISRGAPPDASLSGAYAECGSALKAAQSDFTDVLPPYGSAPGADLFEKYRTFLVQQQTVYDQCITPMFNAAQDARLDAFGKWQIITPLLAKANSEEARASGDLNKSHQEFCKHHFLEPK
jgi:hypothetical protein